MKLTTTENFSQCFFCKGSGFEVNLGSLYKVEITKACPVCKGSGLTIISKVLIKEEEVKDA